MNKEQIQQEFDAFFEFPDGSSKTHVTSTSAKLFAEHVAWKLEEKIVAQQARIEQLKEQLVIAGCNCVDDFIAAGCLQSADSTDDFTALRAHDENLLAPYQRDTERLEWLLGHPDATICSDGVYGPFHIWFRYSNRTTKEAATAREAIDAAIEKGGEYNLLFNAMNTSYAAATDNVGIELVDGSSAKGGA